MKLSPGHAGLGSTVKGHSYYCQGDRVAPLGPLQEGQDPGGPQDWEPTKLIYSPLAESAHPVGQLTPLTHCGVDGPSLAHLPADPECSPGAWGWRAGGRLAFTVDREGGGSLNSLVSPGHQ